MKNLKKIKIIEKGVNLSKKLSPKQLSTIVGGFADCGTFGTCNGVFTGACQEFDKDKCALWH